VRALLGHDRVRLFCFPYAGASAAFYRSWDAELPPWIQVSPVELPGRGARIKDALVTDIRTLADESAAAIAAHKKTHFALFGHSLGALIAFETALRLQQAHETELVRLFVSAHRAPHLPLNTGRYHHLPDGPFLEHVRELGGFSSDIIIHPELMRIILPALRADFTLYETYERNRPGMLHCPISVFGGLADRNVATAELPPWKEHTTRDCNVWTFPGEHFFIHSARSEVLAEITRSLRQS